MYVTTTVEFVGEERLCVVHWEPVDGEVCIRCVEIALIVEHDWTPSGEFRKWTERFIVDVRSILSETQMNDFAYEIKDEAIKRAAEEEIDAH